MDTSRSSLPIHPIAVRRAFGGDRVHPAVPGSVIGTVGSKVLVSLVNGQWAEVATTTPAFRKALHRHDLCRHDDKPLVMLNAHYGLLGLAFGPPTAPRRLAVSYGVCRFEAGAAAEVPGFDGQPGWLLFRCDAEVR